MEPHEDRPLWYVAYGSNLATARLTCYLAGGRPAGSLREQPGARDPSPPSGDRPAHLPHPLRFGGTSRKWDGGVAWLDADRAGAAHGRAWRLTTGQFADLVAQENDMAPGTVAVDAALLTDGGPLLPARRYGRLVALPPLDGEPTVTLTRHVPPPAAAPSAAYVAMLRAGLRELPVAEVEEYLAAATARG